MGQYTAGAAYATHDSDAPSGRITVADAAGFRTDRVQAIRHDLHRHPLLQLSALADLAKSLQASGQCRFIAPETRQVAPFEHLGADPAGRGIDEVFERIEQPGSWVALYNVETDPAYRALLEEITGSVRPLVDQQESGMCGSRRTRRSSRRSTARPSSSMPISAT